MPARRHGCRNQREGGEGHRDETRRPMPARPAGDGKRPHSCGLSRATRMRCTAMTGGASALARLEARVALADHEDLATATHDLAVAVTGLRRFQGGQDPNDIHIKTIGTSKPAILMVIPPPIQALARFFSDRKSVV